MLPQEAEPLVTSAKERVTQIFTNLATWNETFHIKEQNKFGKARTGVRVHCYE